MFSNKTLACLIAIISLLGFLDASYLTIGHYRNVIPPCTLVTGCETVLTSQYSTMFGVPVALGGATYYLFILLASLFYLDSKNEKVLLFVANATILGLLASVYFLSLQIFVIGAYCLYCLGSIATSTSLFIVARFVKKTSPIQ